MEQTVGGEIQKKAVIIHDVHFSYTHYQSPSIKALIGLSMTVHIGQYLSILGKNGSGKSTAAKLVNALELPDEGSVLVLGLDTCCESHFWEIRKSCSMVFQNPDNQIVGTTVEEDVAFGPENIGVPTLAIRRRVDEALAYVGLSHLALFSPSELSGGQKQKLAIAGVLAMQPEILILDESTSMLDPVSRAEFLGLIERLVTDKNMTVIHITHDMDEACLAHYLYVMDCGRVVLHGYPGDVFKDEKKLIALGLDVPTYLRLLHKLEFVLGAPNKPYAIDRREKAVERILDLMRDFSDKTPVDVSCLSNENKKTAVANDLILSVDKLSYRYDKNAPFVLDDISFSVRKGEIFAIIGESGSGKTTLVTQLNGLLRPDSGTITYYFSEDGSLLDLSKKSAIRKAREKVGLIFQYPEYQLFEETVKKDIAYGPKMMRMPPEKIDQAVKSALELVGLDASFLERSPFELSGGQKRRVAVAGVLAMNPDVLIMDEPVAGLDPEGRREMFAFIKKLRRLGKTIILVTHNMDEAAMYADRIMVLQDCKNDVPKTPQELYADPGEVSRRHLRLPTLTQCLYDIKKVYPNIDPCCFTVDDAVAQILKVLIDPSKSVRAEVSDD